MPALTVNGVREEVESLCWRDDWSLLGLCGKETEEPPQLGYYKAAG